MAASPIVEPEQAGGPGAQERHSPREQVVAYDFRRPDALSGDQTRTVQSVHETFRRLLASSLSAYLRTFVSVAFSRLEQLSFAEFSRNMPAPGTTLLLKMNGQESGAILRLSHAALFGVLEILLGGAGKPVTNIDREITEIEKSILDPVMRIMVQELKTAWQPVSPLDFALEQNAAPQFLASISPNEGFAVATLELRAGDVGTMQFGFPSRVVREWLQNLRISKPDPPIGDRSKILRLIERAQLDVDVRLNGMRMLFRDLLGIEAGDVIAFECPLGSEIDLELNGTPKFKGHIVGKAASRAFQISRECRPENAFSE